MANDPPLSISEFTTLQADAWHLRDTPRIEAQIAGHAGLFGEEAHAHA